MHHTDLLSQTKSVILLKVQLLYLPFLCGCTAFVIWKQCDRKLLPSVVSSHTRNCVISSNYRVPGVVCVCCVLSCSGMSDSWHVTPWTVARQAPLPMGFSRQEYWSGLPLPPPGDLPNSGIESASPTLAGGSFTAWALGKASEERSSKIKTTTLLTQVTKYQRMGWRRKKAHK